MEVIYSHSKILEFVESLQDAEIERVDRAVTMLESLGHELRMPHSKSLGGGLFELRILGVKHIRILYAFHGAQIILLNAFVKKMWRIPTREIEYARKILKMYLA